MTIPVIERVRSKRGSVYLACIGIAALLILLFLLVMDVQHVYANRDTAEYELERISMSALTATLDSLELSDHNIVITADRFEEEFDTLAYTLKEKYNWDVMNVHAEIITTSPPSVKVSCELIMRYTFLGTMFSYESAIPVTMYVGQGRKD